MAITNQQLDKTLHRMRSEYWPLCHAAERYDLRGAPIHSTLPGTVDYIDRQRCAADLAAWEAANREEYDRLSILQDARREKQRNLPQHATLPAEDTTNGWWQDNKEQTSFWRVVALKSGEFKHPITVRVWYGRSRNASTCYAALWASNHTRSLGGSGSAGGYGYHRESAAVDEAFRSAGIKLRLNINGAGESAIRDALTALAVALGYRKFSIVHG